MSDFAHWRQRIESCLDHTLSDQRIKDARLREAVRYSCLNGGKRIRAMLVYASGTAFEASLERLDLAAAAVEMTHAYSLIHDDLPAMDDDDLRRGKPSCHRAFDEATAILAGDCLQPLAIEVLSQDGDFPPNARVAMLTSLAHASSTMVAGQSMDLAMTGKQMTLEQLEQLHRRKTGALIRCSVRLGALASERVSESDFAALDGFARDIGLAFQVIDDVLDETGDADDLGKPPGSDRDQGKTTYVTLLGIDQARKTAENLRISALESIGRLSDNNQDNTRGLADLANLIVSRRS